MECRFLLQGVFPNQGSNLQLLSALAGRFLTTVLPRKPYHSLIPLLGIYPKKMKTLIQKDICTLTFVVALFSIAKIGKQPMLSLSRSCSYTHTHKHTHTHTHTHTSDNLPTNAGDVRDLYSIPGSGRSPEGGNGNPIQYSCLENSMDKGA